MKILIIVLSCKDGGIYSEFYKSQKETWDTEKVEGVETFYLFGNHETDEIIDREILVNIEEIVDKIEFSCYGKKTLKSFELTFDLEYDYIFRTNSSSYIDKKMLINFILDKPKNKYYSGFLGKHENIEFASGSGYFISKDCVKYVINNKEKWKHNLLDDVAISKLLNEAGIKPINNPRFNVDGYSIPNDYFHYRLKTNDRKVDINNMYIIKKIKDEFYYGK